MEPLKNEPAIGHFDSLKKVTPLSKYLAMILFIIMPFLGGWIGYRYAPEKIVEIQTLIVNDTATTSTTINDGSLIPDPKYVVIKDVVSSSVAGVSPYDGDHLIYKGDVKNDSLAYAPNGRFLLFVHGARNGTEDYPSPWIYDFANKITQRIEFYGDEQAPYMLNRVEDSIGPIEQIRFRKSVEWTEDNRIAYVVEFEGKEYRYESESSR